jgi:hypothetical protein
MKDYTFVDLERGIFCARRLVSVPQKNAKPPRLSDLGC